MNTYLGFKRTVVKNGATVSEMKFVPVNIPGIEAADGWKLVGTSDTIEVVAQESTAEEIPVIKKQLTIDDLQEVKSKHSEVPTDGADQTVVTKVVEEITVKDLPNGSTFESPVSGTAKLIRMGGDIFIAYRRGKKTLNQTTPNSVCISETSKAQFFAECRRAHGRTSENYRFNDKEPEFAFWNKFIDDEYAKQLKEVNRRRQQAGI